MKSFDEIRNRIALHKAVLERQYGVKEIGLFGSYVRGTPDEQSDVDVLVDFSRTIGLFDFVRLRDYLSDVLEIKVDLVMKRSLKPRIGKAILADVQYV